MATGAFNLSEFIRRLGLRGIGEQPELAMANIRPILVAGDATPVVPPFVPPLAIAGGLIPGVAALFAHVRLNCRNAGGLDVVALSTTANASTVLSYRIERPGLPELVNPLPFQNMGPTPVLSVLSSETGALTMGPADPQLFLSTRVPSILDGVLRLENGDSLLMETQIANTTMSVQIVIAESTPANVPQ